MTPNENGAPAPASNIESINEPPGSEAIQPPKSRRKKKRKAPKKPRRAKAKTKNKKIKAKKKRR